MDRGVWGEGGEGVPATYARASCTRSATPACYVRATYARTGGWGVKGGGNHRAGLDRCVDPCYAGPVITRREILATINTTTRETGYERVLAGDFLDALRSDNIAALEDALHALARVALTPWAFALAAHDICGLMLKRHTVGAQASWSRIPGWARSHRAHPLATLALVCYLVREGKSDREGVEGLLARSGWTS